MSNRFFQMLLAACLVMGTTLAADDPFVGKWKLDSSRSRVIDRMKVVAGAANKYTLIFNGGDPEPVVADGTDQPAHYGTTVSITVEGPDTWTVVRKKDGRTQITGIWKLSEDSKTLTDTFTANKPDGSALRMDYVYKRTEGTSGFPGTWESVNEKIESVVELQIQPYEGDGLSLISSSLGPTRNVKFDGKDYPSVGEYVAAGSVSSGKRASARSLELTDKIKSRVVDTQKIELSPDLKTLTMTVHVTGQSKPNIFVFERE